MIMTRNKSKRLLIPFTACILSVLLCSCGGGTSAAASVPAATQAPSASAESASGSSETSTESKDSKGSSVRDRMRDMLDDEKAESSQEKPAATATPDADSIAKLAKLDANMTRDAKYCVVDVDDKHNPYDVVWDYGSEYDAYVRLVEDAGMWKVLFDAEYYMDTYPMLAMLYHKDEDLLLEHFQTVGIHEGRQGSKDFNVAAYMENCDSKLADAFGDSYECYYFYYALNQKTESKVDVANESNKYPIQMDIALTALQRQELTAINEYRKEVDSDEVTANAEFLAFANYRAWVNYTNDEKYAQLNHGHDWATDNEDIIHDIMMKHFDAGLFAENTVHVDNASKRVNDKDYAKKYRDSSEHYKSMVNNKYVIAAPSNVYARWYEDKVHYCQYDLYLDARS